MVIAALRKFPSRHAALRRSVVLAALIAVPGFASCKTPRAAQGQSPLDASTVDPEYRGDWEKVLRAQSKDPSDEAVREAADELLAREPPADLRVGALHAKSQQAYLSGDDAASIRWADDAMLIVKGNAEVIADALELEVHKLRTTALVRGGDPALAVQAVDESEKLGVFEAPELAGARAVALDRNGEHESAALAFAEWRALLPDSAPAAGYAESRSFVLAGSLAPTKLVKLAERAAHPDAAACLRARAGQGVSAGRADWVDACRELPRRVGVLLPRSGPLAALADPQLAAAVAAVRVLSEHRAAEVLWRDSGSTPQTAQAGLDQLVRDGAQVVVGPVGPGNVAAAAGASPVPLVIPGETARGVAGVAPSLEQRVAALVDRAAVQRATGLVLLAPANPYGDRVAKGVTAALEGKALKLLKTQRYDSKVTSFRPVLEPVMASARAEGRAVLIADSAGRTELVVRQLRRAGLDSEHLVLATAEGLGPQALRRGASALEALVVAPVAAPGPDAARFVEEYERLQGEGPGPQALLVWRALSRAWAGEAAAEPDAAGLWRVKGGRLVPLAQEAG